MNDRVFRTKGIPDLQPDIDYEQCQTEPIHQTTSIQPHGTFLAITPEGDRISAVAENIDAYMDLEIEDILNTSPKVLFGRTVYEKIQSFLDQDSEEKRHVVIQRESGELSGTLFPLEEGAGLELQRSLMGEMNVQELMQNMTERLQQLGRFQNKQSLLKNTISAIQSITGMDRVLIYKFGEKGHGKVIAEERNEDMSSYLNHHFPATDIPEPARRLYRINRIRFISDVNQDPVPIVIDDDLVSVEELDLTYASLRNVPEVHRQYMRNMGVISSLSISIMVKEELWGLITAHGKDATQLSWAQKNISRIIGQITSRQIQQLDAQKRETQQKRIEYMKDDLRGPLDDYRNFFEQLRQNQKPLFSLMDASHFYMRLFEENIFLSREASIELPENLIEMIQKRLEDREMVQINSIANKVDESWDHSEEISGFLAVKLGLSAESFCVWFRPEIVDERTWGGDPRRAAEMGENGHLNPRDSFEDWVQIISDSCRRWSDIDAMTAQSFVKLFESLVLRVQNKRYKRLNQELNRLASTDDLTGLPNRRTLMERLNTEMKRANRYGHELTFAILDLDHFKKVNDRYGHPKGDEVLKRFAELLQEATRESDLVARFGGEEFAILFPQSSMEEARQVVERLRESTNEMVFEAEETNFHIACSAGLTQLQEDEEDVDRLIKRADVALYQAKEDGRNCVRVQRTLSESEANAAS